jgi:predicted neutral ceramidase superfamily lipid hydrolase
MAFAPNTRRRIAFVALVSVSFFWGALGVAFYHDSLVSRLIDGFGIIFVCLAISLWSRYDSQIRAFVLTIGLRLLILLVGIVGVPLYFWQSRSRRDCVRSFFGLYLYAALYAAYLIGWYCAGYILTQTGYFSASLILPCAFRPFV